MAHISIYDSTLRDGAQAQGISYSVEDKLKIVERLDALGVTYIEAGNPGSNPKDLEFFARAADLKLKHSRIIAFGAHPDDCDVVAGGTAILYSKLGHRVKFVSMTNGDAGHQSLIVGEPADAGGDRHDIGEAGTKSGTKADSAAPDPGSSGNCTKRFSRPSARACSYTLWNSSRVTVRFSSGSSWGTNGVYWDMRLT